MNHSAPQGACVIYANYSTHLKPHSARFRDGLTFYLFRLQAEGSCRALVEGKYETIIPGDLLLYPPDQPYELIVQPRGLPKSETVQPVADYFLAGRGSGWMPGGTTEACRPKQISATMIRSLPCGSILSAKRKR